MEEGFVVIGSDVLFVQISHHHLVQATCIHANLVRLHIGILLASTTSNYSSSTGGPLRCPLRLTHLYYTTVTSGTRLEIVGFDTPAFLSIDKLRPVAPLEIGESTTSVGLLKFTINNTSHISTTPRLHRGHASKSLDLTPPPSCPSISYGPSHHWKSGRALHL